MPRGVAGGYLEIQRGHQRTIVQNRHVTLDSSLAISRADDKIAVHALLAEAGLPLPRHVEVSFPKIAAADEFRRSVAGPLVVKPARGTSGGAGVTCGVTTADELLRACLRASRWNPEVLVEEQVRGTEYRALVLDGKVLDVVRRRPPSVVGDGMSDIAELVAAENERRRTSNGRLGYSHIAIDLDCALALRRQGASLRWVPPRGERIFVKSSANDGGPQDTATVHDIPPELQRAAELASQAAGLRLAGVELVTPDHTLPLAAAGGAVIEINGAPGLHYHYQVRHPDRATQVAAVILDRLLSEAPRPSDRLAEASREGM